MTDAVSIHPDAPMRLVIAGGGTGGHVLPAVAVVEEIRRRKLPVELLWIGGHPGVESEIARAHDIPFTAIQTGKLRRYLSIRTFSDATRIPVGAIQAWRALRAFRPDVIYGTGGAISFPTILAGARIAPILTHEQTAQIGIANKLAMRFADTFAASFEQTAELACTRHRHVIVTG
ncbi:MAG: glycosyltransferase, partial [Chloroflexota bacterium]|nr:glycosyltransferase [Chloroflexota bacterium]